MKHAMTFAVFVIVLVGVGALAYATPVGDSANIQISATIPAIPGLNAPLIQEDSITVRAVPAPAPAPQQQATAPAAKEEAQPIMTEQASGPVVLKTVYVP